MIWSIEKVLNSETDLNIIEFWKTSLEDLMKMIISDNCKAEVQEYSGRLVIDLVAIEIKPFSFYGYSKL